LTNFFTNLSVFTKLKGFLMALDCYFISGSPFAWRALLALSFKGLDFNMIELKASEGEHKAPDYLALNPHGQVPALKDGDTVIYESLAILGYLDRKYPETPLFGTSNEQTALIWQRVMEFESWLVPVMRGILRPIFFGPLEGHEDEVNENITKLKGELDRFSTWLDGNDFLAGDTLSAVDISVYPAVTIMARVLANVDNDKLDKSLLPLADTYPKLAVWAARIEAQEGFDAVYPPHWRD
jgi:glutathione S-transferase